MKRITSVLAAALVVSTANAQSVLSVIQPNPVSAIVLAAYIANSWGEKTYYVKVEATGRTEAEARTQGFKAAVEEAIGSLVLSETEVQRDTVTRAAILNYSSGYVDNYKILSKTDRGDRVVIVMEVWVKRSKIADRLLSESAATGQIDGSRIATQQLTLVQERNDGDQALSMIMRDYPGRALDVTLGKTRAITNPDRTLTVSVPYVVTWNSTYLEGFYELVTKVSDHTNVGYCLTGPDEFCARYHNYVTVQTRPGRNGWQQTVAINDNRRYNLIAQTLQNKNPVALVTITKRDGSLAHRMCYNFASPNQLVWVNNNQLTINGYARIAASANIRVDGYYQNLEDWANVSVAIISENQCPKPYTAYPNATVYR